MPDGSFQPEGSVTREAFAKMMVLTFRATPSTQEEPTFLDVGSTRWSYSYVEASKDFLTGYTSPFDGTMTFHPEEYATREDIAVALVRMMGLTEKDASNPGYAKWKFSDGDSISPSLLPYVSVAAERGLINGFTDGTFGPQRPISRAETVALLNRASKQAVTTANGEIPLEVSVSYDKENPKIAYLTIGSAEGTTVTVDGQSVEMSSGYYDDDYVGLYTYTFEAEGSKEFTVAATKMGKSRTVQATAKYEIGAPKLTVTECPTNVSKKEITIGGTLYDDNYGVTLTINGESVNVRYGSWSKSFILKEGENTFTIIGSNSAGKTVTETRTVNFSVGGPRLTITECPSNVSKKEITIGGTLYDDNYGVTLTINGESVNVRYGSWSKSFILKEGENTFTIIGSNSAGKTVTETRTVNFSVDGPKLTITECPATATKKDITIRGRLSDSNYGVTLTINGEPVNVRYEEWSKNVTLSEGENTFTIVASNEAGKATTETRTVVFNIKAPTIRFYNCPSTNAQESLTITGNVESGYGDIRLFLNGESVKLSSGGDFTMDVTLSPGENTFEFRAVNAMGKETTEIKTVVYEKEAAATKNTED